MKYYIPLLEPIRLVNLAETLDIRWDWRRFAAVKDRAGFGEVHAAVPAEQQAAITHASDRAAPSLHPRRPPATSEGSRLQHTIHAPTSCCARSYKAMRSALSALMMAGDVDGTCRAGHGGIDQLVAGEGQGRNRYSQLGGCEFSCLLNALYYME